MKHLSDAPLWGRLLVLPTNIRLGRKGLSGTNTLAYDRNSKFTGVKSIVKCSRIRTTVVVKGDAT